VSEIEVGSLKIQGASRPSLAGCKEVGPFVLAGALLSFCVSEAWLIRELRDGEVHYYVTPSGADAFRAFNIDIDLS
jgi:hypothetical protein